MKKTISTLLMLLISMPGSTVFAEVPKTEGSQRKIVSRVYQITDGALLRCTGSAADQIGAALTGFVGAYPELILLMRKSQYYQRAVNQNMNLDSRKDINDLKAECRFYKSLLVSMTNTDEGRQSVADMVDLLKLENVFTQSPETSTYPPHLWSDHKYLEVSVSVCAENGHAALKALGYLSVIQNGNFTYGNHGSNRAAIKCVANNSVSFVYLAVAGPDKNTVERLRNELFWKL